LLNTIRRSATLGFNGVKNLHDPSVLEVELTDLVYQAESGDAHCSTMDCVLVAEPEGDSEWDDMHFFDSWDAEDDDQCVDPAITSYVQESGLVAWGACCKVRRAFML
jgi:hypothetical protein